MVVVPGNSVESIAITEVPMGGGIHEYYYDAAAIAEPVAETTVRRMKGARSTATKHGSIIPGQQNIQKINLPRAAGTYTDADIPQLRNKRDVWQINTVRTGAVSYTHLDVYKRQPLCIAQLFSTGSAKVMLFCSAVYAAAIYKVGFILATIFAFHYSFLHESV